MWIVEVLHVSTNVHIEIPCRTVEIWLDQYIVCVWATENRTVTAPVPSGGAVQVKDTELLSVGLGWVIPLRSYNKWRNMFKETPSCSQYNICPPTFHLHASYLAQWYIHLRDRGMQARKWHSTEICGSLTNLNHTVYTFSTSVTASNICAYLQNMWACYHHLLK